MIFYQAMSNTVDLGPLRNTVEEASADLEAKGYDVSKLKKSDHGTWFDNKQDICIGVIYI